MHVYVITNTANGKLYIGQHAGYDLQMYLREQCLRANRPSNANYKPLLYRAIRKYGAGAFCISSLVRPVDKEQMNELEKFFIRTCEARNPESGYNLAVGGTGGATRNGYTNTVEQRRKASLAHTGKPKSQAHRYSLSKSKLGILLRPMMGEKVWCSLGKHFTERAQFSERYGKRAGSLESHCKPCLATKARLRRKSNEVTNGAIAN